MKRINDILVCLVFIVISKLVLSQGESKDVSIIVTGSGKTVEEAKQVSLRNAIEQAYGTFISAKTEVLNDQVLSDEISSVSSGNIKSYEILSQDQLPNGLWATTLKTIVSVDKLKSFVESKGLSVEIKGGLFALNIKQQMLNEQGEIRAITDMLGIIHESMQISFDYSIKSSIPQSLDSENKNWAIPLEVTVTANKNIVFCAEYFIKILKQISLSQLEVETYNSLNKKVYPISVIYKNNSEIYYLRKINSRKMIKFFASNSRFYTSLFKVQYTGIDETKGEIENPDYSDVQFDPRFYSDFDFNPNYRDICLTLAFPSADKIVRSIEWKVKRTLSQIEQINSFNVTPIGVLSKFKYFETKDCD